MYQNPTGDITHGRELHYILLEFSCQGYKTLTWPTRHITAISRGLLFRFHSGLSALTKDWSVWESQFTIDNQLNYYFFFIWPQILMLWAHIWNCFKETLPMHHNKVFHQNIRNIVNTGFQVGPTFPIFPTFPYFFDLLQLYPTFSWKCPTIPTFSV